MSIPRHLARLHALALADEVSAHHTHAWRNVLGSISASAFFVRHRVTHDRLLDVDPRIGRALDAIERHLQEASAAAPSRHLFRMSPASEVMPSELARRLLATFEVAPSIRLAPPRPSARSVAISPDGLELALACLVENACDAVAANDGGVVRIGIDDLAGGLCIVVDDDGPGLRGATLEEVARPFFTTKENRVGMGFNIARRLVASMGGHLTAHCGAAGFTAQLAFPPTP